MGPVDRYHTLLTYDGVRSTEIKYPVIGGKVGVGCAIKGENQGDHHPNRTNNALILLAEKKAEYNWIVSLPSRGSGSGHPGAYTRTQLVTICGTGKCHIH